MWKHIPYSPGVYKIKNIKNKISNAWTTKKYLFNI